MSVIYRKATAKDVSDIYKIELACFSKPWSFASLYMDICINKLALYIVAQMEDEIIGYCGVHTIFDEGHIMNVAVLPDFRRLGIGEGLITTVISLTGLCFYTLEVRESNQGAINLYNRLGFEIVGKRPNYYGDEDALIMWKGKNAP